MYNAETILKKAEYFYKKKISQSYSFEQANKDFSVWVNSQSDFSGGEKAYNKFDEDGKVFQSVSMAWPNKKTAPDNYYIPLVHPRTKKECSVPERGWRNPPATMDDLLNQRHPLYQLSHKINWQVFEDSFTPLYCADNGRPAKPIHLMCGLFILKYLRKISDKSVVEQWSENDYF